MGKQFGECRLEDAELIAPGVSHDPVVIAACLLVVPPTGAKSFEAAHLRLYVVGFEIEVHPLLAGLRVRGVLEKHPTFGVW